jgi:hypothetical protein
MITDDAIRVALINEYEFLCHEDFNPDEDMTIAEYSTHVATLNREQLVHETCTDEFYSLEEFIDSYGD